MANDNSATRWQRCIERIERTFGNMPAIQKIEISHNIRLSLEKCNKKIPDLETHLFAIEHSQEIVNLLTRKQDDEATINSLVEKWGLSTKSAKYILSLSFGDLLLSNEEKIKMKIENIKNEKNEIEQYKELFEKENGSIDQYFY